MKTKLLILMIFCSTLFSYGQNLYINKIAATPVTGGITINLLVTMGTGAGFLSSSYTITGSTINLSVCYWFDSTLPIHQINNDFFIPTDNSGNFNINVNTFFSSSQTTCDYYSSGPSATTNYLSTRDFEDLKNNLTLHPNPTSGRVEYDGIDIGVKKIKIFDNFGRLIKNILDNDIDFTDLNEGIYFVKMETEKSSFTQKIIVKK